MGYSDLHIAVKKSERPYFPYVRFTAQIDELDDMYPTEGTLAQILDMEHVQFDEDTGRNYYKITFAYDPFITHNQTLEKRVWYDKDGNPTLTATEAGYYKPVDDIDYLCDEETPNIFEIVYDERSLPFENPDERRIMDHVEKEIALGAIPKSLRPTTEKDLVDVALYIFAKGDFRSHLAILMRTWAKSVLEL